MEFSFEKWMSLVESLVYNEIKINLNDLPDEDFRMNYNDGLSPNGMATIVLNNYYAFEDFLLE
jgi:hypothetical protein